jgi:hypothetical protein
MLEKMKFDGTKKGKKGKKGRENMSKGVKDNISLVFKTMRNVNSIESKYWKINII